MAGQGGFFDTDERLRWLSAAGDPLERLAAVVDFELFRPEPRRGARPQRPRQGRPAALRCGADVPHSGAAEPLYAVGRPGRIPAARPAVVHALRGLALREPVPDAKTIWLFREQLVRAGAFERLFAGFDAALAERDYLAMGGQIVDATIVEARRPRLTRTEKDVVKGGGIPKDWKPARTRQIDRDGRWTLKRGKRKPDPARRRHTHGVRPRSRRRCSATRTTSASTARTASCAASPSLMPQPKTARCSTPATPRVRSGPTPPIDRQPTSRCWSGAA